MKLLQFPRGLYEKDSFGFFEDFEWYVDIHRWTKLTADTTPTVAVGDAAGGIVTLFTDTTDNNEVALKTTYEIFKFAAGKPLFCESRIQYSENDTNKANVFFGFSDAIGANQLLDNGAGPKTTMSGMGIYKVDGSTVWKTVSSKSTTQTLNTSTKTAGGTAYQVLRIEGRPVDATTYEITYFVDGVPLRDSYGRQIKDNLTLTSATEMQVGLYAKTGGGAGGETVLCDYIAAYQKR